MKKKPLLKWLLTIIIGGLLIVLLAYFWLHKSQEPLEMNESARRVAPGEFLELSRGTTHYSIMGPEDGRLIVLIHGGMVSGMYAWEKNHNHLVSEGFRVLMYDLYGRGFSDRVNEEYTPELFFSQFEELLDSLNIREPLGLAGLSLGSMVAIDYTSRYPEKVESLALISPAARGKFKLKAPLKIPLLSDLLMAAYWFPRTINSQMEEFYRPEDFPEYREKLEDMVRYKGYKSSNYSTWTNTLSYDMEPQIKKIGIQNTPVMLILGMHDPYVSADEAETYKSLIPSLQVRQIEGAGHVVNFEKANTVNKELADFFKSSTD